MVREDGIARRGALISKLGDKIVHKKPNRYLGPTGAERKQGKGTDQDLTERAISATYSV